MGLKNFKGVDCKVSLMHCGFDGKCPSRWRDAINTFVLFALSDFVWALTIGSAFVEFSMYSRPREFERSGLSKDSI
jgi:hypothetical protein